MDSKANRAREMEAAVTTGVTEKARREGARREKEGREGCGRDAGEGPTM